MKELKQVTVWHNVAIHVLASTFSYYVIVYLLTSVAGLLLGAIFLTMLLTINTGLPAIAGLMIIIMVIIKYVVGLISAWFAPYFSAKFLKKRYVISQSTKQHIAKLSTILIAIIIVLYFVISYLFATSMTLFDAIDLIVVFIPHIIIFYFASKKYLPVNASAVQQVSNYKNV